MDKTFKGAGSELNGHPLHNRSQQTIEKVNRRVIDSKLAFVSEICGSCPKQL